MVEATRSRRARATNFLLLLLLSYGLLTKAHAQGPDTTDYFPLQVGNTYLYYHSLPCPPSIVNRRIGPWVRIHTRDTTIAGKKYFGTAAGLARVDSAGNVITIHEGVEQVRYKLYAAVGDTWRYIVRTSDRQFDYIVTMQSRTDTVRVHAGTFTNCLRMFFDVPRMVGDEFTDWLAPGVGIVFRCRFEPLELYEATVGGVRYPVIASVQGERNPVKSFTLYQNYPNPFNPETIIKYELGTTAATKLIVVDLLGKEVKKLVDDTQPPGTYEVRWDGTNSESRKVASGVYIYQIVANNYQLSRKALLVR